MKNLYLIHNKRKMRKNNLRPLMQDIRMIQNESIFRRLIITIFLSLNNLALYSQYPLSDPAGNKFNSNAAQATPNAGSLGKYVDCPVSYFSGIANIDIPLYEIKDGDAHLPISISYYSGGIRVEELSSWVGLGWSLNAGGAIMRTVRGLADEGNHPANYSRFGLTGYLNGGLKRFPKPPYTDAQGNLHGYLYGTDSLTYATTDLNNGALDGESDIYSFNFDGHVGKFIFDENATPRLLKDDNLKISYSFNSNNAIQTWTITTPDGIQYIFGENNATEHPYPQPPSQGLLIPGAITAWYLTSVIYPNNKDTIHLKYTGEMYLYANLGGESVMSINNSNPRYPAEVCYNLPNNGNSPSLIIYTEIAGVRLTEIQTINVDILFYAQTQRRDLTNSSNTAAAFALDSIKIYSKQNGNCIKQWKFSHGYFGHSTASPISPGLYTYINNDNSDSLRLKLLSLQEFSGDGSVSKPPYQFTYQDSLLLPRRLSYAQDHWGYNNGDTRNSALTPGGLWLTAIQCNNYTGANREPAWPQMSAGILTKIKDPLGVTTRFDYEPNYTDYALPTQVKMVGGLRIKQITTSDNVTGNTSIRKYQYSGGILYKPPVYGIQIANEFFYDFTISGNLGYKGPYPSGMPFGVLKQSESIIPMQDYDGRIIGYNKVMEIMGANGENGRTVYGYDNGITSPVSNSSKLKASQFMGSTYFNGSYSMSGRMYLGNGLFNEINPQDLLYDLGYFNDINYPSAPPQVDLDRGNLLQVQVFDAANNLQKQTVNTYNTSYHEDYWTRGVKGFQITGGGGTPVGDLNNALTFYKTHTGISNLVGTIVTDYANGVTKSDTIKYAYESPYHTLSTCDTTIQSSRKTLIRKTYYSFDYNASATSDGIFGLMQQKNILAPVSKEVWINGMLTEGIITQYKDFNIDSRLPSVIKPSKIYWLATNIPLNQSAVNITPAYSRRITLIPNNQYIERVDEYNDGTGLSLQVNKVNDINTSYQWGYNGTYPVAKVINAGNNEHTTVSYAQKGGTFTFARPGSTTSQSVNFTTANTGTITMNIYWGSDPGTNPTGYVRYQLSGASSASNYLCLAGCNSYPVSISLPNMPKGTYMLTVFPTMSSSSANLYLHYYYPGLQTAQSGTKEFFYEGFEDSASAATAGGAHTGIRYWSGSYQVNFTPVNNRSYIIQWWSKNGNAWVLNQQPYQNSMSLSGQIDDIRIFPTDAQITTYTYAPLLGMTSETDPAGNTIYYEYDGFGRLKDAKDKDGNVIKKYDYHYQGQ